MEKLKSKLPEGETYPEDIFKVVGEEVKEHSIELMRALWLNWTHLGVNLTTKTAYVRKISSFTNSYYEDVLSETNEKMDDLKKQITELIQKAKTYSTMLPTELKIPTLTEDLALIDYKCSLQEEVAYFDSLVKERQAILKNLQEEAEELSEKMGASILDEFSHGDKLPSDEVVAAFKRRLAALQAEREKRMEQFLCDQAEIKEIMKSLKITPENKFELVVVSSTANDFSVSDINMSRLSSFKQRLRHKYEKTNNMVLELREQLGRLWQAADVEPSYQETFLGMHPGCHPDTERALREEIERCVRIKQERMKVRITTIRNEIAVMWERCQLSQEERQRFIHYDSDCFSEEALTLHEVYLADLTAKYEMNRDIFELNESRKQVLAQMATLEARGGDPGRFHNRGGQLLREEKERKALAVKLPRIEEQLRTLLAHYVASTGKQFLVNGHPLIEAMQEEAEARKMERKTRSERKKTPGMTPVASPCRRNRSGTYTVLRRGASQVSLTVTPCSAHRTMATPRGTPRLAPAPRASATPRALHRALAAPRGVMPSPLAPPSARKTPAAGLRKRTSGRFEGSPKRKLTYNAPKVNGSILQYKRTSNGRRTSSGRARRDSPRAARPAAGLAPCSFLECGPKIDDVENINNYTAFLGELSEQNHLRSSNKYDISPTTPTRDVRVEAPRTPLLSSNQYNLTPKTPIGVALTPFKTPLGSLMKNGVKIPMNKGAENESPRYPLSAKKLNTQERTKSTFC